MQTITDGYYLGALIVFLLVLVKAMFYVVNGKDADPVIKPTLNISEKFIKRFAITFIAIIYIIFFYTIFNY